MWFISHRQQSVLILKAFLVFRILQFRFRFCFYFAGLISGYEMRAERFQMQGYFG